MEDASVGERTSAGWGGGGGFSGCCGCNVGPVDCEVMAANVAVEPSELGVVTGVPLSEAETLSTAVPATSEESFANVSGTLEQLMTTAAPLAATDDNDSVGAFGVSVAVVGDVADEDGVALVVKAAAVAAATAALVSECDNGALVFAAPAPAPTPTPAPIVDAVAAVKDDDDDCDCDCDCDVGAKVSLFTLKAAAATAAALLKPKLGTNSAAFTFKVENFVAISALS